MRRLYAAVFALLVLPASVASAQTESGQIDEEETRLEGFDSTPLASSFSNPAGQPVPSDSVDAFIARTMSAMGIPGAAVAIVDDGRLVYHGESGFADVEEGTPVDVQTLFEGASMSKPVFAFMVMSLVEAGRLDLDRPVHAYFGSRPAGIPEDAAWYEKLTLRMLLSHSTGLPNWREADTLSVAFEPGTEFSYSGEGYILLERAVQEALGTDYRGLEAYFQRHVAAPLGMTSTQFVQDSTSIGQTATPYRDGEALPLGQWEGAEFNSASSIHSNALDFSRFLVALTEGLLLSEESYEEMFAEQVPLPEGTFFKPFGVTGWTLGFAKHALAGRTVYGHLGNNEGFSSSFLVDREARWGLVAFTNADLVPDFGYDLFRYISTYD